MSTLRRPVLVVLMVSVFLLAGIAQTAPALCCLFEVDSPAVEVCCCGPTEQAPSTSPCDEQEDECRRSCCSATPTERQIPVPQQPVPPSPSVAQSNDRAVEPISTEFASFGLRDHVHRTRNTPIHLCFQVLLC